MAKELKREATQDELDENVVPKKQKSKIIFRKKWKR